MKPDLVKRLRLAASNAKSIWGDVNSIALILDEAADALEAVNPPETEEELAGHRGIK